MCKYIQAVSARCRSFLVGSGKGNTHVASLLTVLASLGGCSSTPSTCVQNPQFVTQVTVYQVRETQIQIQVIDEPERIKEMTTFLRRTDNQWKVVWDTPSFGRLLIVFEGEEDPSGSRRGFFVRMSRGTISSHIDGKQYWQPMTKEDQEDFLRLLDISPDLLDTKKQLPYEDEKGGQERGSSGVP